MFSINLNLKLRTFLSTFDEIALGLKSCTISSTLYSLKLVSTSSSDQDYNIFDYNSSKNPDNLEIQKSNPLYSNFNSKIDEYDLVFHQNSNYNINILFSPVKWSQKNKFYTGSNLFYDVKCHSTKVKCQKIYKQVDMEMYFFTFYISSPLSVALCVSGES